MQTIQAGAYLKKEAPRIGAYLKKEAPQDVKTAEAALEILTKELGDITGLLETNKKATDDHYKELTAHYNGVKADSDEIKAAVQKHTAEYAELIAQQQALRAAVDQVKKEMDAPLLKGGTDLVESDRNAAIELQRRAFLFKGGQVDEFVPDLENLTDAKAYRSAVRKLMKVGIESKAKIVRSFDEYERKAFESASLDSALFSPEMLGLELNCITDCGEMLDLYNSVSVGKSTFMYPQVMDYGSIGQYDCDAKCDAEYGPEGNITFKSGSVSDFRGVFCLHRKTLTESNYDLLGFMYTAANRSYRINRNRALISGDGVNQPLGWLTADCFTKMKNPGPLFNHVDFRLFYASAPIEYGEVTAIMHQNMFAYLSALTDAAGRFLFGDGLMTYSPSDVRERIRISNCLPDATAGLTKGNAGNPFVPGDFLCAAGSWKQAYYVVNKRPLWIEQYEGGSTAWCVKYVFGAEDGGFTACCAAARILTVGP